jgi:hypothetical protein
MLTAWRLCFFQCVAFVQFGPRRREAALASDRARSLVINYVKCSDNSIDRVRWAFQNLLNNKANSVRNTRRG